MLLPCTKLYFLLLAAICSSHHVCFAVSLLLAWVGGLLARRGCPRQRHLNPIEATRKCWGFTFSKPGCRVVAVVRLHLLLLPCGTIHGVEHIEPEQIKVNLDT